MEIVPKPRDNSPILTETEAAELPAKDPVTPKLDAAAARALTNRIRGALVAAHDGLVAAF